MENSKNFMVKSERVVLDGATGEVISEEIFTKSKVRREPTFVKVYMEDLLYLKQMPYGLGGILWEIIQIMDYDNVVHLTAMRRNSITENLGCSIHNVNKAISVFTKNGLMSKRGAGSYIMNPYVFGKGSWDKVSKIRAEIEWSETGRKVTTTIYSETNKEG